MKWYDPTSPEFISAPYNFVPLAEKVFSPDWGGLVSHDVPFEDGYSGVLHYTLEAMSPLLVGGKQEKEEGQPGKVWFHRTGEDFTIPGSSIRGMVRGVFEVATFSRMRQVDDMRHAIRDISGQFVKDSYTDKIKVQQLDGSEVKKFQPGLLRMGPDGKPNILPCKQEPISQSEVRALLRNRQLNFNSARLVADKYKYWLQSVQANGKKPSEINDLLVDYLKGKAKVAREAVLVFTGWIPTKRNESIFYDPKRSQPIEVFGADKRAWADFLHVHGDDQPEETGSGNNRSKNKRSWPGYWRRIYREGGEVPVYYFQDEGLFRIGLAKLPRLAGDFSVHDLIKHSSEEHLNTNGKPDMTDLLFGTTEGDGAKGRVHFSLCRVADGSEATPEEWGPTILNGPKASFFPNYLEQKTDSNGVRLPDGETYATYLRRDNSDKPKIRGWKRYPARPKDEVRAQNVQPDQGPSVQVKLFPLKQGVKFTGRVVFHNLKPEELGALVWSLRFGNKGKCLHSLGMGKPFGFGQVKVTLDHDKSVVEPNAAQEVDNAAAGVEERLKECVTKFIDMLDSAVQWRESPQVEALAVMAMPEQRIRFQSGELQHMSLDGFRDAKRYGLVLKSYLHKP